MVSSAHILSIFHTLVWITCVGAVILLDPSNFDTIKGGYKFTLITFGAEWCPFSQQLKPILEDASGKIVHLTSSGIATIGTVDCVKFSDLCGKENIRKYPTVKYALYGEVQPQEYRGDRNAEALVKFITDNLAYSVTSVFAENKDHLQALGLLKTTQATIVGLFPSLDPAHPHQIHFAKAATLNHLRCAFYILHGVKDTEDRMAHIEEMSSQPQEITTLKNADYASIGNWIKARCVQYVSELTFTNAESITDQGRPLFILFYVPGEHEDHRKAFAEFVKTHLLDETDKIIFLYADGRRFSHPLLHIGKSLKDLPLLVMDSLAHMYVFPGGVLEALNINDPSQVKQFIADLHSGKLHRRFHNLDEPSPVQIDQPKMETRPPESVMKSLSPSRLRYTLLHDEF